MDFNKILVRIQNMLMRPKTTWPTVAAESTTVAELYKSWIVWLAAIPAVFGFIKNSLIGYSVFGMTVRVPVGAGLRSLVIGYILSLVVIYLVALIIDALAPTFSAQKNRVQALKTVAYAGTAAWVASIAGIVPWLGALIMLAGAIYSIYLLYTGLPHTMGCPPEKAAGYTAVTIIIAVLLSWIVGLLVAGISGTSGYMKGKAFQTSTSSRDRSVTFDESSTMGRIMAAAEEMERKASRSSDKRKQRDADDAVDSAAEAMGMLGAMLGGGDAKVEALPPATLREFLPERIGRYERTEVSAERQGMMGVQVSEATAKYRSEDGRSIQVEIKDLAGVKGLMAMAGFAGESERETNTGFERSYSKNGEMIKEKWNSESQRGEFSMTVGKRFSVSASGQADSFKELQAVVGSLDLKRLEKMRNEGVEKG